MRLGIANGAVTGRYETSRAHPLSGLPMAANDTK